MNVMADVLRAFTGVKQNGVGWAARCPAHDDRRASLSISRGQDGRWLVHCHAGCSVDAVLTAAGLEIRDLFPPNGNGHSSIVTTYPYHDEHGVHLFDVVRLVPKDFRQRRADGVWKMNGVRRVLYRLPELQHHQIVFITEGEKDADRLWTLEFAATTNPGGAGKWRDEYAQQLRAAGAQHVVVVPDNDDPGHAHAEAVAASCAAAGLRVTVVSLPDVPAAGDVSDFLDAHTPADWHALVAGTAPRPSVADVCTPETADDDPPIAERCPVFVARLANHVRPLDLVTDLVPSVGSGMLHGQPRSFKSYALLELALAGASATPAFGRFVVPEPFDVWYITEEDPELEVQSRVTAVLAGRDLAAPDRFHLSVERRLNLDDPHVQRRVIAYARDCHIRLTIIDPIRASSGAVDQGPRELQPFRDFSRTFRRDTGSVLWLAHHDTKLKADGQPDPRPHPQRASGGGLFSIVDCPIHTEKIDETHALLTPSGYKFGVSPDPFIIALDADAPKAPSRVRLTAQATTATDAAKLALHQKIRAFLQDHPATSGSKIAQGIHARKDNTLDALEELYKAGDVDNFRVGQKVSWSLVSKGQV